MPGRRYVVVTIVLLGLVGLTLTASPALAKGNSGGVVVTNYPAPEPYTSPSGIVAGPDGALWFTNDGLGVPGSIGRMTTTGALTTYTDPSIDNPLQIAVGSDGALWFTNFDGDSIGRITTAGSVSSYSTPGLVYPASITADSDGALWFTYEDGIGRINTAGVITNLFIVPGVDQFGGITTTSDGALWFIGNGNVERMTTAGVVTNSYHVPSLAGDLVDITTGSDGALWVTTRVNPGGGLIARVTPGGAITTFSTGRDEIPYSITSGPDGALWVTAGSTKSKDGWSIMRLTMAGVLTSYEGPGLTVSPRDTPQFLTPGPDGAVWFTDATADSTGSIGRISVPKPAIMAVNPSSAAVGHSVHIDGFDLSNATSVTFDGTPARVSGDQDTKIVATVPPGAASGPVVVTTPDGVATADFTVPLPIIAQLSPGSGAVGTAVSIKGTNLLNATVTFNGTAAVLASDGAKKIVAIVPPGASSGAVVVTTPDGTAQGSFEVT